MTSSSDTELLSQRRVSVHGLPTNCQSSELRTLFSRYGGISAIHVTRQGHGFVTFDEEESANAALSISGETFRENRLTVKLSQFHDSATLPVTGAKREIYFPRPFGARGGQSNSSSSGYRTSSAGSSSSSSRVRSNATSGGLGALSSRGGRASSSSQRASLLNRVRVVKFDTHCGEQEHDDDDDPFKTMSNDLKMKYLSILSFVAYPEISCRIFTHLDIVSLYRCRLVCRDWAKNIRKFVLNSTSAVRRRRDRWTNNDCSIFPIFPTLESGPTDDNPENRYRNVLTLKADEKEIMIALDNGNVEVYDRFTLKLLFVLSGEYSISPVALDFNSSFILVNYTCGFVLRIRNPMPSSWWTIFMRKTGRPLKVIEREFSKFYEDVRLGSDNLLHLVTKNSVHFIDFGAKELLSEEEFLSKTSKKSFCLNVWTYPVVMVGGESADSDFLDVVDIDSERITGVVRRFIDNELIFCVWNKMSHDEILELVNTKNCPRIDFMTGLVTEFPILENYSSPDFDRSKCSCLSLQLRYPLALVLISNNRGLFEVLNSCRPYVLFVIVDVANEQTLRVVTLDCSWMLKMSDMLVPYDCDTCVLTARFNNEFLVAGFGSSSDLKDGGIAVWSLEELLDGTDVQGENNRNDSSVFTLSSPVYHWSGWDGHTGGVTEIHLDSWSLIAVNACKHQVTTRCIERIDEVKKDNVLVYDFWSPGKDERREQR